MKPTGKLPKLFKTAGEISAIAACGVAAMSVWAWIAGVADILSGPGHSPSSPLTALVLLVMSFGVLLLRYWPERPASRTLGYASFAGGLLAGGCAAARACWNCQVLLENWLNGLISDPCGFVPDVTSPLTGLTLTLVAGAMILQLLPIATKPMVRWLARLLAASTLLIGLSELLPHLFTRSAGLHVHHLSMPSSVASIFLGFALLELPLQRAPSATSETYVPDAPWRSWLRFWATVAAAVCFGLVTAMYLRHQQLQDREDAEMMLATVGKLKQSQILQWREERLSDAHFFSQADFVSQDVARFIDQPNSPIAAARLKYWLNLLKADQRYSLVALFDTNFVVRSALPEAVGTNVGFPKDLVSQALASNHVVFSDLHHGPDDASLHIDILVPVTRLSRNYTNATTRVPGAMLGLILLRLDPHQFLFPLLKYWPSPSESAETILFQRQGPEVVYLNDLRHRTNTEVQLRFPISTNSQLTSVKGMLSGQEFLEGMDYRGVEVMANVRPVTGTTWYIAAKIDRAEVYDQLVKQSWLTLALTVAVVAGAGFMMGLIQKLQEAARATEALELETRRRELAERIDHLMRGASDAIIIADEGDNIIEANRRAQILYGYTLAEFQRLKLPMLRVPAKRQTFRQEAEALSASGRALMESVHQRKDGTTFPVEISSSVIQIGSGKFRLGFLRDITERQNHEREIERLNRLYAMLSEINQSIVRIRSRDELFQVVCEATVKQGGFKLAWIGWHDRTTGDIVPLAHAGEPRSYIDQLKLNVATNTPGLGAIAICIRDGQACVINDFMTDERVKPWQGLAREHGLGAVASVPIRVEGEICGVLTVYSEEVGIFKDREIALLNDTAFDVSFALDHLAKDAQRVQAEEALRRSESLLRSVTEGTPDAIYVKDLQGRYVMFNGGASEFVGKPVEAVIGYDDTALFNTVDATRTMTLDQEVIASQATRIFEEQIFLDGKTVTFLSTKGPIRDGAGKIIGIFGISRDISERKQSEERIRRQGALINSLLDSIPDIIFFKDTLGVYLGCNPAFEKFVGRHRQAIVGHTDHELFPKEVADSFREFDRAMLAAQKPQHNEEWITYPDGTRRLIDTLKTPYWGPNGELIGVLGISRDITDRKAAELALQHSETRLSAIFHRSPVGIVVTRLRSSVILDVNAAFASIHGYAREEMVGRTATELNLWADPVERESLIRQLQTEGGCLMRQIKGQMKDGALRDLHITAELIELSGETCMLGLAQDITEELRREKALRISEARLRYLSDNLPNCMLYQLRREPDGKSAFIYLSDTVRKFHGCTAAEAQADPMRIYNGIPEEDRERIAALEQVSAERLTVFDVETRLLLPDGTTRWAQLISTPRRMPDGAILWDGIEIDITARKQAEEKLRESEVRFRTLVEAAPEAIFVRTGERFTYLNAAALALFGATFEEQLLGQPVLDRFHHSQKSTVAAKMRNLSETGQHTINAERTLLRLDGTAIQVVISALPFTLDGEKSALVFARDITARKRQEISDHLHLQTLQLLTAGAPLAEVLKSIVTLIEAGHESWRVSIMLVDETKTELVCGAAPRLPQSYLDAIDGIPIGVGVGSCGTAAATREMVMIEDIETHPYWVGFRDVARGAGLRSCWSMPIFSPTAEVLGALAVYQDKPGKPSSDDLRSIEAGMGLASIAISRRQSEDALIAHTRRLKLAFATSHMGVWEWDMVTDAIAWLEQSHEIMGLPAGAAQLGMPSFRDRVHPDDRVALFEKINEAVREHKEWNHEFRIRLPNGSLRWVTNVGQPLYDEADNPTRMVGIVRDITERKEAEDQLRKLSRAVEQSPVLIVITDPRGSIEYVNPKFTEVTGYTLSEVLGKNPRILKSGETPMELYANLWQTVTHGETWRGEMRNRKKSGELYWESVTISPVIGENGSATHFVAVKTDITQHKQLEAQLRQMQKMEAIGQLAGGVAHDFNNILAAMMMQVDLTGMDESLSVDARGGLQEIRSAAERAANLTRQLLLFGRRQIMQSKDLDLNELVTGLSKMLRRIIGEDIRLQLNLSSKPLITRADAGMLDQVLLNLVVNARDAMPDGGRLVIETSELEVDANIARLHPDATPGRYVALSVNDTGCGIAPEVQARMFEPFFTTKAAGKGTGLGLATVFGIVKQHKGWVRVYSEPGQGAHFRVVLPASHASAESSEVLVAKPKPRGGTETILLAEDDHSVRLVTQATLERHGYKVLPAADGVAALKIWEAHHASIALLLTDLVMPGGVSGMELAKRLQARNPQLKVIYSSGYSAEIAGKELELRSGENFVQKPSSQDELIGAVRRILDN